MAGFVAETGGSGWSTAFRFALRELRGGLNGFYVFLACIALGAMTISGVNSVSRAMIDGLSAEGQTFLGGDLSFSLIYRQVNEDEAAFLDSLGTVSNIATLRAMARKPDTLDQTLVEIKAIDSIYPLYGTMILADGAELEETLRVADGVHGAAADLALLARLDLKVGDRIRIGTTDVRINAVIEEEPDRIGGGLGFGPRLMMTKAALEATELVQPGSLVRWHYRIRLSEDGIADFGRVRDAMEAAKEGFPQAGWRIRSRANAAPGLQLQIRRFSEFLTLVGLTALIIGGVGVANAVRAFLDAKRPVIATFKCLGAPGPFVFKVYLIQILALALAGIGVGLILGSLAPLIAGAFLAEILPIGDHVRVYPSALALAVVYGLLTALAFTLWPLGRAHDIQPTALFRDRLGDGRRFPRPIYLAGTALAVVALAGLALAFTTDARISVIYIAATAGAFVLLRLVATGVMALARRLPHPTRTEARMALANIYRPGALTPSVILSLGLGLTLLVALALIDGNLRHQLTSGLPDNAPSFFFVDIQDSEADGFETLIKAEAPTADLVRVPMLRGRMVTINDVAVEDINAPADVAWALRGDRGLTYSASLPESSDLLSGSWWEPDHSDGNLVSFESDIAEGLGIGVGDSVKVNVLGREITATVANTRRVQWESLAINFVMVFSPNTFAGAPHTHLATVTYPEAATLDEEIDLLRSVTASFPTVTSIRVKDALDAVNELVAQLAVAVRVAAGVALVASVLVLAGALAAGHRYRIYDAVILKTVGATRGRVMAAFILEYCALGLVTAAFAIVAGTLAAYGVLEGVMSISFIFMPATAFFAVAIALALTVGFGLTGTWRVLGQRPAPILRNL
ncbi:MAG: FtsX-like permease family protein [Pseudomonadota bacterium]